MADFVVETKNGKVEGFEKDGISRWYGIPYAKPPLGNLRFRRAVKCDPWEGIKECKTLSGRCPQFRLTFGDTSKDNEDCLYLNIWRKNNDAKKLPVLVYIHGGYLHFGGGVESTFHGDYYAKDDILYVSINYRLGPLGCYDFSIYNKEEFDSNCSLSDQIMALKWVNENIEAFGGDPNNVTINGESAGGASVLALTVSPAAKGLFQKVICQSGYPDGQHFARSNKILMDMFLEYLNFKPEEAIKIKDLDYKKLKEASDYMFKNIHKHPGLLPPSFVYDDLLPEEYSTYLRNGSARGIKIIIGCCKNEASFIVHTHECTKNKEEIKQMFENNNLSEKFPEVEEFYFNKKKGGDASPPVNFSSDYMFKIGSIEVADIQSQTDDVWVYRMDYEPILPKSIGLKACHGIDVHLSQLTYDNVGLYSKMWLLNKSSSTELMKKYVHYSWVNFIKTGNPNGDHLNCQWEKYNSDSRKILIFDKTPVCTELPEKENVEFWKSVIGTHHFYK